MSAYIEKKHDSGRFCLQVFQNFVHIMYGKGLVFNF